MKNTAKNPTIRNAVTRPSQRPGAKSDRTTDRLVAVKESSSDDEERGKPRRHDEQQHRDRGRAVEVRLRAEGGDVCELIEGIVLRDLVPARLGEDLGFREQLGPGGDRDDGHVRDPLPNQRDLDVPRGLDGAGAVTAGSLHDLVGDVVQRAVHDDDPSTGTGPERNHREDEWQVVQVDGLNEVRVPEPLEDE